MAGRRFFSVNSKSHLGCPRVKWSFLANSLTCLLSKRIRFFGELSKLILDAAVNSSSRLARHLARNVWAYSTVKGQPGLSSLKGGILVCVEIPTASCGIDALA